MNTNPDPRFSVTVSYMQWQEQHPNATEEEIREFWESQRQGQQEMSRILTD